MGWRGKPAHVRADLRQDGAGRNRAEARHGGKPGDIVAKGHEAVAHRPVQFGDGGLNCVRLRQMEAEHHALVRAQPRAQPPAQGFDQLGAGRAHFGAHLIGEPLRIALA